ncbi:MAG: hypothetical protein H0X67_19210 [Acidobacteria bacterium]|nr:hypothetical protein [Acidobacteriota bacterium]
MRKAISITLSRDNLLWLKGQAGRTSKGSVSEVLDQLVADARRAGHAAPETLRSVVGSVDLPDDADLQGADLYIRTTFAQSARQPFLVRERPPRGRSRRG